MVKHLDSTAEVHKSSLSQLSPNTAHNLYCKSQNHGKRDVGNGQIVRTNKHLDPHTKSIPPRSTQVAGSAIV